jgi:hypothetical protein
MSAFRAKANAHGGSALTASVANDPLADVRSTE